MISVTENFEDPIGKNMPTFCRRGPDDRKEYGDIISTTTPVTGISAFLQQRSPAKILNANRFTDPEWRPRNVFDLMPNVRQIQKVVRRNNG